MPSHGASEHAAGSGDPADNENHVGRVTHAAGVILKIKGQIMKMRTTHEIVLRTIFGIVLLLSLTVFSASCQKPEKSTGPKEKVTIGVAAGGQYSLPFIIAREKGFFQEEGLEATIRVYPSGKMALEAMFAGEVDSATVSETPIVLNSFMRDDFAVFATVAYSYDNNKVIGRRDRGVSKPADLKGKTIGFTAGTSSHFFVQVYLTEHGIEPSAVKMVDFAPTDLPGALKEGKVDAIAIFEPYASMAMKVLPDKAVRLPRSDLYKQTSNLAVMRSYAKGHSELLKKVLKAVDRAITFIKQNRNESIAVMTKSLKPGEDLLVSLQDDPMFELSLEHSLLTTLEDEARWAIANKFTDKTKVPNYLGYFYLDAMKAVKPEAVSIIK
jgi:NitT/TauT family transport system substrate-binding protein